MKCRKSKLAAYLVIVPLCGTAIGSDAPMTLDGEALDAVTAGGTRVLSNEIPMICGDSICPGFTGRTVERRVLALVPLDPSSPPEAPNSGTANEQPRSAAAHLAAARIPWKAVWSKQVEITVLHNVSSTVAAPRPVTVSAAELLLERF